MAAKDCQSACTLRVSATVRLFGGILILSQILLQTGLLPVTILFVCGSMLISCSILGFISAAERSTGIITLDRLRTLAALHTATGVICIVCMGLLVVGMVVIQRGACGPDCATYMGIEFEVYPWSAGISNSRILGQTTILVMDLVTVFLYGTSALRAGCLARQDAALLASDKCIEKSETLTAEFNSEMKRLEAREQDGATVETETEYVA